ncbi:hypothetical protein D3C87_1384490 [compost metagenome]
MQVRRIAEDLKVELGWRERLVRGLSNGEGVVEPRDVAVGAAASELRCELVFRDLRAFLCAECANGLLRADVAQRDPLVLVDEEHRALGGGNQLFDLVLAQVAVQAALLVQAVRLVHDQHVELVCGCFDETTGAREEVGVARARHGARELGFVDAPRGGVLRNVLAVQAGTHQGDQCVDGEHRLASPRAAFDDHHLGGRARCRSACSQDVLVDLFLVIDQDELGIPLQQARKAVAERLRWPDAAVGQFIEHARVAELDVLFDEVAKHASLGLALQEQRRFRDVAGVVVRVDDTIALVVVQIRARLD